LSADDHGKPRFDRFDHDGDSGGFNDDEHDRDYRVG
jgi:hypothetical protein